MIPVIRAWRVFHTCTRLSASSNHVNIKKELKIPNLTDAKWKRRSKLTAMNFANKNKSGHRQRLGTSEPARGPTPSKREREALLNQRPKEQLPKSKANQSPRELSSKEIGEVYEAIKQINVASELPNRIKLPGKIDPRAVTLLDSRQIQMIESSAAERIRQRLLESGLPADLAQPSQLHSQSSSSANNDPSATSDAIPGTPEINQVLATAELTDSIQIKPVEDHVDHQLISEVIYLNSKTAKPKEAEKALQILLDNGLQPTVNDYNRLMDAYVNAKDLPGALQIFQRIRNDVAVQPNVKSFGIILKCLTQERRLVDAFKVYEQMKALQLTPSQPIYTTLIKACSQVGDYNRAWRLFEHMRNEVCRPDEITMNHMIHICAKSNNVEKALLLFDEFHRKPSPTGSPLIPLESTFNSLIHACARRPDYYAQTFDLVQQMQEAGFQPDKITYNYMFMACRAQGDVWRAKALWSEMITRATETGNVALLPDEQSYTQMLQCYSRAPALLQTVWRKTVWDKQMAEFHRQQQMAKIGLENEERVKAGLRPIDINEWLRDEQYDPDVPLPPPTPNRQLDELRKYVLEGKSEAERLMELKGEAISFFENVVCNKLLLPSAASTTNGASGSDKNDGISAAACSSLSPQSERKLYLSVHVLNAQLQTLGAFHCRSEMLRLYRKFQNPSNQQLQPNGQTYLSFLRHWYEGPFGFTRPAENEGNNNNDYHNHDVNTADECSPQEIMQHGWSVYEDYERYRRIQNLPDRWEELETKFVRNKWQQRGITHEHRRVEYEIYRHVIAGLAKHGDLVRATRLLALLLERGHARITNMMHLRPDHYSPTRHSSTDFGTGKGQLRNSQFSQHSQTTEISPEVDKSLFDGHTAQQAEPLVLLQKYTSPHLRHLRQTSGAVVDDKQLNPSYAPPVVQFRPKDFLLLLDRCRDSGDKALIARVEELLTAGRRLTERKEQSTVNNLQLVKNKLRKRWHS